MPRKMYQEISAGLQEYDADEDIWVIVVRAPAIAPFSPARIWSFCMAR